jgi:hypothetical protein
MSGLHCQLYVVLCRPRLEAQAVVILYNDHHKAREEYVEFSIICITEHIQQTTVAPIREGVGHLAISSLEPR